METRRSTRKIFCIIRFYEENFLGIKDVCIPYSWIISHQMKEGLVKVSYPIEDRLAITKKRVKRKENFKEEWPRHLAKVIYRTDNYRDAERWLAAGTGGGHSQPETSRRNDTEPRSETLRDGPFIVVLDQKPLTRFIQLSQNAVRSNCHHNDVPVLPIFDDKRNLIGYCRHVNSLCRGSHDKIVITDLNCSLASHEEMSDLRDDEEEEEEIEERSRMVI